MYLMSIFKKKNPGLIKKLTDHPQWLPSGFKLTPVQVVKSAEGHMFKFPLTCCLKHLLWMTSIFWTILGPILIIQFVWYIYCWTWKSEHCVAWVAKLSLASHSFFLSKELRNWLSQLSVLRKSQIPNLHCDFLYTTQANNPSINKYKCEFMLIPKLGDID